MAKKNHKRSKQEIDDEDEEDEDEEVDDDEEADEDDEEDSDDDEDEDEPSRKSSKSKRSAKKSKKRTSESDDDEDEDGDEDSEDDEEETSKSAGKWFSNDVSKMGSDRKSDRFKFEPDTEYELMFLKDSGFAYHRHYVPSANKGAGGYFTCPTPGSCPICKAGNNAGGAAAFHVAVLDDKKGETFYTTVIEGARFAKKFTKQKQKRGTLQGVVFGVEKTGAKMETDWSFEFKEKRKLTSKEKAMLTKLQDFAKLFKPKEISELKTIARGINSDDED